ncbi:MAG: methionyl-tRNA formyltransferase [Patescibacteria group bacterium]|nr:methionyl-tRNA formyltransferase [Patescibacteria group bacterium]
MVPRIIFMGTPAFAVPSLEALKKLSDAGKIDLVAVVTTPDKKVGRKQQLQATPVKEYALTMGVKIVETNKVSDPRIVEKLTEMQPDLMLVVAFGQILPESLIQLPPFGTFNIHGSLLPRHRGASPVQASILAGDSVGGISLQKMVYQLDAGDVCFERRFPLDGTETTHQLMGVLARLGRDMVVNDLSRIWEGTAEYTVQDESHVTFCGKIDKKSARLSPEIKDAILLDREVRAYYSWPLSWMMFEGKRLQIHQSIAYEDIVIPDTVALGEIFVQEEIPYISCLGATALQLVTVKLEGKGIQSGQEFAKAYLLSSSRP